MLLILEWRGRVSWRMELVDQKTLLQDDDALCTQTPTTNPSSEVTKRRVTNVSFPHGEKKMSSAQSV